MLVLVHMLVLALVLVLAHLYIVKSIPVYRNTVYIHRTYNIYCIVYTVLVQTFGDSPPNRSSPKWSTESLRFFDPPKLCVRYFGGLGRRGRPVRAKMGLPISPPKKKALP